MTTRFIAHITKYALTAGIQEVEVEDCFHISPDMVGTARQNYHGSEWHRTRADAVKRAKQMRTAKIASLRKSIVKLEGMRFE